MKRAAMAGRGRWMLGCAIMGVVACGDSSGGDGGTGTESDATGSTSGLDESTGGSTSATTGGSSGLQPCDPRSEQACEMGLCAGTPFSGFYCRAACSNLAEVGTECGSDGVCLPTGTESGELACFSLTDCDFTTGQGCDLAAGESCVVVDFEPLRTACVPSGDTGPSMQCEPWGMHACDVGTACLGSDIDGDDPGVCTLWCVPGAPVPAGCSACIALTAELGTCAECSVIENDCPEGSQCHPTNEALGGICTDHGPGGDGDPCSIVDPGQSCQDGFVCVETDIDDTFACVQKCDPNAPMCEDPDKSCIDVGLIIDGAPTGQLGFCIPTGVTYCNPDQMPTGCPMDEVCLEVEPGLGICGPSCDPTDGDTACVGNDACVPELDGMLNLLPFLTGNGACGASCSTDGDCMGGTCLLVDGLDADGVCGTTCTPANPMECGMGEACVATVADPNVGACVPGGASCDPATPDSCVGQPATACIALDGGATGTCMTSCFVQDPAACGAMPAMCREKTDAIWHTGVCLGQPQPCDVLAQDCGPGQSCSILAGGPIGGQAFICEGAGPLMEGGDCSQDDDACSEGLECIGDVCRRWCDPQADDCMVGTCTDVSSLFYLPMGTVGVCM